MEGTIKEFEKTDTSDGYLIVYENINTTNGNSGSPIFLTSANSVKRVKNRLSRNRGLHQVNRILIGVHCGGESKIENYGSLITKDIYKWLFDNH